MKGVTALTIIRMMSLLLLVSSQAGLAIELKVVDQHGKPLSDAVVEMVADQALEVPLEPAVMDQKHRRFAPRVLAIRQGRYVALPNSDNVRHHVYSFSPAKTFELKLYKGVPGAPMQFDKPGLVTLGCNIHDGMIGYIYVAENQYVGVSDDSGAVRFDTSVKSAKFRYWHPDQVAPQEFSTVAIDPIPARHKIEIAVAPDRE